MCKYGIIAAMSEEMREIKKIMNNIEEEKIYELIFYKGKIKESNIVLVECGIGKVNAARVTQILIENFDIDVVINVGSSASANEELDIGDIVIGEKLVQYDFDMSPLGYTRGFIKNIGPNIKGDNKLINKMKSTISQIESDKYNVEIGTIVSGDRFCTDVELKNNIRKEFEADAIDMESAAIAQVCYLDNKSFIIIRSISDKPNGTNETTFEEFLGLASKRCAMILERFIEK